MLECIKFHDLLLESSLNKVYSTVQDIVLKLQLYEGAADLSSGISIYELKSDSGVKKIIIAVYQREFFSVFSGVYEGFQRLLDRKWTKIESLKNFGTRFSAVVTKFNSLPDTTKLS